MAARKRKPQELGYSGALRMLVAALHDLGLRGMLIGGAAVIARGVPRTTRDIVQLVSEHWQSRPGAQLRTARQRLAFDVRGMRFAHRDG